MATTLLPHPPLNPGSALPPLNQHPMAAAAHPEQAPLFAASFPDLHHTTPQTHVHTQQGQHPPYLQQRYQHQSQPQRPEALERWASDPLGQGMLDGARRGYGQENYGASRGNAGYQRQEGILVDGHGEGSRGGETQRRSDGQGQETKLSVRDFDLLRTLGTGTFARVWLVRLSNPAPEDRDKVFALKVLRKAEIIKLKQVDHVNHERAVLHEIAGHPFITTLITTFADADCVYMLLDYCPGGEVFSYLRKAKRFPESTARFYAAEIVLILEYLHEHEGIAYRDLKPENLLLDAEGHIKLVDFGFAKRLGTRETYTLCGTPEYLAPEVIQSKGHTTAVDWWALGILIYEFLTGYPPFWHSNPIEIYKQIVNKPLTFPSPSSSSSSTPTISPAAKSLIRSLCTVDRSHRLGNISGGAARVKAHPFFDGVDWEEVWYRKRKGPIVPPVRWHGDAECFERYPDETMEGRERYTAEMRDRWEGAFADF